MNTNDHNTHDRFLITHIYDPQMVFAFNGKWSSGNRLDETPAYARINCTHNLFCTTLHQTQTWFIYTTMLYIMLYHSLNVSDCYTIIVFVRTSLNLF